VATTDIVQVHRSVGRAPLDFRISEASEILGALRFPIQKQNLCIPDGLWKRSSLVTFVLFNDAASSCDYIASNGGIIKGKWIRKTVEVTMALFEVLPQKLPEELSKTMRNRILNRRFVGQNLNYGLGNVKFSANNPTAQYKLSTVMCYVLWN
jgi:hypothetical protein